MSAGCVVIGLLLGIGLLLQLRQSFVHSLVIAPALQQVPLGRVALFFANGTALAAGVVAVVALLGGAGGLVAALAAGGMSDRWLAAGVAGTILVVACIVLRGAHHVQVGVREAPARIVRGLAWSGAGLAGLAALVAAGMLPGVFQRAAVQGWGPEFLIAFAFPGIPLVVALVEAAVYAAFRDTFAALDAAIRSPLGDSAPEARDGAESR